MCLESCISSQFESAPALCILGFIQVYFYFQLEIFPYIHCPVHKNLFLFTCLIMSICSIKSLLFCKWGEDQDMEGRRRRGGESDLKRIEICYVPSPCDECNRDVLQTYTDNKYFICVLSFHNECLVFYCAYWSLKAFLLARDAQRNNAAKVFPKWSSTDQPHLISLSAKIFPIYQWSLFAFFSNLITTQWDRVNNLSGGI